MSTRPAQGHASHVMRMKPYAQDVEAHQFLPQIPYLIILGSRPTELVKGGSSLHLCCQSQAGSRHGLYQIWTRPPAA